MHRVISDYFSASTHVAPMPGEDAAKAIREHHMIADALARRDRELARTVLRTHLDKTIRHEVFAREQTLSRAHASGGDAPDAPIAHR